MKLLVFKSIRNRLLFWFLFLSLVPLVVGFLVTYNQQKASLEHETINKLKAIRDLKVQELNKWISERIGDIQVMAGDYEIRDFEFVIDDKVKSPEELDKIDVARELLKRNQRNYENYEEIFVVGTHTGVVELSSNRIFEGINKSNNPYFTIPMKTGDIYIKDIYYSKEMSKPQMTFSMPIYCLENNRHIVGVLVARISLEKSLYKLLQNRVGLGETGETLIVNEDVIALNELRYFDNAPLNLKILAESAVRASQGLTGITVTDDYRGEEILAAYTHIPETGWGFVCKQDKYELDAPLRAFVKNIIVLFIVSGLLIVFIVFWIIRRITKPIVEMNITTSKIKDGDYSVRTFVESSDELASLSESINEMAKSIESRVVTQKAVVAISETIIAQSSMHQFGSDILKELMTITGANMSTFYILNEVTSEYEHFTSVGANIELLKPFNVENPEGEFGNAISTRSIYYLRNIQEDTIIKYKTTAGSIIPKEIITIPIIIENTVVAIISLVNINKFSKESYDVLNQSWTAINTSYSNLLSNERTRIFAQQLTDSNQQLEAQTEELQDQAEEMQDQAEELQRTSDELQEQNIELDTQKKQVESANKLKSEFLSNMSHELRTPLNSIMALSRVLIVQAKDKLSDEENDYLEIVERNGKNLLALINDILDLSKIEAGKMDILAGPVSIGTLVRIVKENMQSLAVEKGLALNLKVSGDLPKVVTDESKIHQALLNIVSNAVKFTEKGSVDILVEQSSENIIVQVEDSGIGISKEMLPHIFDEFRQVDGTSSRKYEGTGLGLAIASKLLNVLGGSISVQSEFNKGTVFTITIPIKWHEGNSSPNIFDDDSVSEESKDNETDIFQGIPKNISETTILIVEDNKDAVIQLHAILDNEGYHIMIAENGQEALEIVEHKIPDGIILDLMMPGIDGFEVLDKLRSSEKTKNIPVLILTAKDLSKKELSKLKSNNIQQLIQKGDIDIDGLLSKVRLMHGYGKKPEVKKKRKKVKKEKTNSSVNLPKVLVVEDNADNMITIKAILGDNFNISEAVNGEQGLMIAQSQSFDLILLDMSLPKLDGEDMISILKNDNTTSDITIIAVTAQAMKGDKEKFLKAGCDAYVSKPVDPDILLAEIERLLG